MYQNQGYVAATTTTTANFTPQQQQEYYNYYYPQQQHQQQQPQGGVYYPYHQPPLPPTEPKTETPPPQPPGGGEVNSNDPLPPGDSAADDSAADGTVAAASSSSVIESVAQGESEVKQEEGGTKPQVTTGPSLDAVPKEQSGVADSDKSTAYNPGYAYPQPTPITTVAATTTITTTTGTGAAGATGWNGGAHPALATTCSSQWYTPQGSGVVSWGGAQQQPQPDWSNYHQGNWQQSGWSPQQQQQPPHQQQQQQGSDQGAQWGSGGWNQHQWVGQGGVATGQWAGQWQGQPGVEAWSGQAYGSGQTYGVYQQQDYSYPNYGNSQQQQQQQPPLPKPLPNPPRPPSPGTPPLPDLPSPGGGSGGGDGGGGSENQGEAGTQQEGYQVQGATTGGGHLGRKHQRTNDHGGGNGSGKRTKKGSNDDGQGLPHGNEGGGNNSGKTRQRGFGSRSRWSDPKENKDAVNYNAVPPPNLPLPTPKTPPARNFSYHQRHQPQSGQPHQLLGQPPGQPQPYPPSGYPLHSASNPYPPPYPPPPPTPSITEHHNKMQQQQQEPLNGDSSALSPSQNREKMPLKMKEYVTRAFSSATTEEEREVIHHHLDSELNEIFAKNQQWSIDWDTYPMPLDEIKKKPSRWDTPSPGADFMALGTKRPSEFSSPSHQMVGGGEFRGNGFEGNDDEGWGLGRGRGKKRKKKFNRKRGKNNQFFIDHQPIPGMSLGAVGGAVTQEDKAKIDLRINRFGKQGFNNEGNKNTRKKISIDDLVKSVTSSNVDEQIYWQDSSVEGTSQALEKRYLRLTSAPDPSMVRPLRVLKLSLHHVCEKWKANPEDYHYACEQFKSIRQDLTIQGIRDAFTVEVYETHARVALQNNDREEFNQCQTQLMALYKEEPGVYSNEAEFIAYRILYLILTQNTEAMSTILLELTPDLRRVPCIKHTQTLCSAWFSGNYSKFFKLYKTAPLLCGALINIFIERERKMAIKTMTRAYRPNLPVSHLTEVLGFPDRDHCLAFLVEMDAVLVNSDTDIDCKLTQAKLSTPAASS